MHYATNANEITRPEEDQDFGAWETRTNTLGQTFEYVRGQDNLVLSQDPNNPEWAECFGAVLPTRMWVKSNQNGEFPTLPEIRALAKDLRYRPALRYTIRPALGRGLQEKGWAVDATETVALLEY